jgi:hypothetical protein
MEVRKNFHFLFNKVYKFSILNNINLYDFNHNLYLVMVEICLIKFLFYIIKVIIFNLYKL